MCQKESWGAIFATTEAHSTQRDQPPRMHGPGLWMYEQKVQRVTPVRMIGVNCILWSPGWDGKDLGGRPSTSNALSSVTPCQNLSGMKLCCRFVGFLAVECLADFRFLMLCNAIYLCYYFPNSSVYLSLPLEDLSLPALAGVVVSNSGDLSPEKTCMCNSEVQFSS